MVTPGVATPSEIMMALSRGLNTLKFFPAEELGGTRMLQALAGPFPDVRFMPLGGINPANLAGYLAQANVLAVGADWLATDRMIAAGDFEGIRRLTTESSRLIRDVSMRNKGSSVQ